MTAVGLRMGARMDDRTVRRALFLTLFGAIVLAFLIFQGQMTLPHDDDNPLFQTLNGVRDWANDNRSILEPVRTVLGGIVGFFDDVIASLGWPGVMGVAGALAMVVGGLRLTLLVVAGFASLGVLGLWDPAMQTLSLMLASVVIALIVGLPLGILAGRNDRATAILSPILDVMQIMPTLAYLVPVTALFFIGAAPATVATLIYAIPPAVRITSLGIRGVPATSVEAARALGSTNRQV